MAWFWKPFFFPFLSLNVIGVFKIRSVRKDKYCEKVCCETCWRYLSARGKQLRDSSCPKNAVLHFAFSFLPPAFYSVQITVLSFLETIHS